MRTATAFLLSLLALPAACAKRSEQDIQEEFQAYVGERNHCAEDGDCELVYPGCPLGCFVAVNRAEATAVKEKADELVAEYESEGQGCAYACMPMRAICASDRCDAVPEDP